MKLFICVISLIILNSCSNNTDCYPNYYFGNFTSYKVTKTDSTIENHVKIDDPKKELNIDLVEKTLNNVVNCVSKIAETGFTDEEFIKGECLFRVIDAQIRECLTIKVAPNWYNSKCNEEEVFPCSIGNFRCEQKGIIPTQECPCSCRGIIQDQYTIIITPNMKLLPATFTTMMTGCINPWIGRLDECADIKNIAQ